MIKRCNTNRLPFFIGGNITRILECCNFDGFIEFLTSVFDLMAMTLRWNKTMKYICVIKIRVIV